MLLIIAIWFVLAGLLIGLGGAIQRVFTAAPSVRLSASFWTGWAVWIGILQLLHFRTALGTPWVLALLAALGSLGLLWNGPRLYGTLRECLCERRLLLAVLAILGLWLCNRGLGPLLSIDAGIYHLTSIKWAAEAPLVGGLGNLHGRLAFNSTAFLWLSSLDQWPSLLRAFNVAPGLLLIAAIAQMLHGILAKRGTAEDSPTAAIFHLTIFHATLLLPLLYAAAVMHVSSTSPDWIGLILGIVLASQLAELFSREPDDPPSSHFLTIAALCAAGITVKLSFAVLGATALAVAAFRVLRPHAANRHAAPRSLGPGLLLALLLLIPWSLRSIELSGYPAYPSTYGAVEVSWRVPKERVEAEVRWIRSWARTPGKSPGEVLGNPDWIIPWLANRLHSSDSVALLVFPAALFALGLLTTGIRRDGLLPCTAMLLIPYAVAVLAWFLSAPDPRFLGSSLWVCAAGLLAGNTRPGNSQGHALLARRITSGVSALCAAGFLVFIGYMGSTVGGAFIRPGPLHGRYPLRSVETKAFRTQSGLMLHVPREGDQCWEAPLPCTPYPAPRLGLRDDHAPFGGFELK